ncbi:hypothetical protein A2803_05380 [Candidatus Woesebacteria bacterium RIFCSPHIGHO2_01_FULL_44_21]|uniref:Uncharacterized protein n=1 Tax=Candidatus Woesebacteria bacterium RIFCSPHIGHO2_01_FULL_44_21 TaxID=1802503 RepID=A0A1F7YXC3_9BACT|nr:MAG: hypothetical protein A2803_05380 [Candidatus Woesebacteria bacterium RIFCSPHIGHO2_01_FULL_44_21]OGM68798.1 MAG: hypothetical protein A2897_01355 [Candidatus Woesebacteria bacterium RIFCSPLOWO2_01_FULL_44_24b]
MNNKKPLPKIVVFAILTTITTFVWIGFEIVRAITKEPSPTVSAEIMAELDSNLDTATLTELTQRIHIEESEIGETQILDLTTLELVEPEEPEDPVTAEPAPEEEVVEDEVVQEATEEGSGQP